MVRHFFLDKTNTMILGSQANLGLSPVAYLTYGIDVTRILVHFPVNEIENLIADATFANRDKLSYTLHMTNCTSINGITTDRYMIGRDCTTKERASSFTILALKLPQEFDAGSGYEAVKEPYFYGPQSYTENGSNWYKANNENDWPNEGIYTLDVIADEFEKFKNGEDSLVVASQHFDYGDEDLNLDVTKYVNQVLDGEENFGLCLCFTPDLEMLATDMQQYVGFFTDWTNTFFHPYLEVNYNEYISDDRESFYAGKENRLYFYSYIDGKLDNLDNIPTCTIDGTDYPVTQATKGVYYATAKIDGERNSIHYDLWSNLYYNGEELDNLELEFVILPKNGYIRIGTPNIYQNHLVPCLSGINDDEDVNKGDIREVVVDFRKEFTTNKRETTNNGKYRLYTKDGEREIDIFNGYIPIEKSFLNNYFLVYSEDLIPGVYYVDVAVSTGKEERFYKNVLTFKIVNNVTRKFC